MKERIWESTYGPVLKAACLCCGTTEISAHKNVIGHIISVANGGPTVPENLRPICVSCNSAMSEENMNEYIEKQGREVPQSIIE